MGRDEREKFVQCDEKKFFEKSGLFIKVTNWLQRLQSGYSIIYINISRHEVASLSSQHRLTDLTLCCIFLTRCCIKKSQLAQANLIQLLLYKAIKHNMLCYGRIYITIYSRRGIFSLFIPQTLPKPYIVGTKHSLSYTPKSTMSIIINKTLHFVYNFKH